MTNTLNKIIHNGDEYEFPSGEVGVSSQANNIFTPGMKIWGGTETDYQSLTPDSNTAYLLLADQPTPPSPRQPGANTIAYYPLTDDFSDYSGNSYNLTQNNTNITTIDGVKCCDLNNSFASANFVVSALPYTICFWAKAKTNGGAGGFGLTFAENWTWGGSGMGCRNANKILVMFGNPTDHPDGDVYISTSIDTNRHLRIGTFSSSGFILYKDGTQEGTYGSSLHNPINSTQPLRIGANETGTAEYSNGYMGGVIVEDKVWTEQEIQDYFDQTKADYGIS